MFGSFNMTTNQLRYETYRDLYFQERNRREHIRQSISTPVAAFAFSVFNLSTLAVHYELNSWSSWPGLIIALFAFVGLMVLLVAAILIIRVEWGYVYLYSLDF